jgi:hypothetical protein
LVLERAVTPTPGSAPGFSQPLSGFQASPSSRALFHAPTVSELPPPKLSPREDRVPLSGPPAPLRLSTVCAEARRSRPYHLGFPRLPRLSAVALVPTETIGSLFTRPKPRFPVTPDHQRRDHSLPPASPVSKPSSLRKSVRTNSSCPAPVVVALLGFFPSEDRTFQAFEPRLPARPRRAKHDAAPVDTPSRR